MVYIDSNFIQIKIQMKIVSQILIPAIKFPSFEATSITNYLIILLDLLCTYTSKCIYTFMYISVYAYIMYSFLFFLTNCCIIYILFYTLLFHLTLNLRNYSLSIEVYLILWKHFKNIMCIHWVEVILNPKIRPRD